MPNQYSGRGGHDRLSGKPDPRLTHAIEQLEASVRELSGLIAEMRREYETKRAARTARERKMTKPTG